MKHPLAIAALVFSSFAANAVPTLSQFSGYLVAGQEGTFSGVLLADLSTGVLTQFYSDVHYSNGVEKRYDLLGPYDVVSMTQGDSITEYWSDGHTGHYTGLASFDITVTRFQRDQYGRLSVDPDPAWTMFLGFSPTTSKLWGFSESNSTVVPCGPTSFCWETTSSSFVSGRVTSMVSLPFESTVPEPASALLVLLGLGVLGFRSRRPQLPCRESIPSWDTGGTVRNNNTEVLGTKKSSR